MEEIKTIHKILGYDENLSTVTLSEDLVVISTFLKKLFSKNISFDSLCNLEESVKSTAIKFFSNNSLILHDVLIEDESKAIQVIKGYENGKYNTYYELVQDIYNTSKYDTPFNIPIRYVEQDEMYGKVFWRNWISPISDELAQVLFPINNSIELSNKKTNLTSSYYIHEIIHTELHSKKGSVEKYYNSEILSIFLEKVSALQKDDGGSLLVEETYKRYRQLLNAFYWLADGYKRNNKKTIMNATIYIVSTLKAEKLFDIYLNSGFYIKSIIMSKIQLVFDGVLTLEDMLNELEITYKNSMDVNILKKHIN